MNEEKKHHLISYRSEAGVPYLLVVNTMDLKTNAIRYDSDVIGFIFSNKHRLDLLSWIENDETTANAVRDMAKRAGIKEYDPKRITINC